MRAVVFANGRLTHPHLDRAILRPDDWILAADGGAVHCRELGVVPDVVIGDLDSAPQDEIDRLRAGGAQVLDHPRRKDQTDLELALAHAYEGGADEIVILAAMGERWDQTLANVLLLRSINLPSGRTRIVDGTQQIGILRGGDVIRLDGLPGDTVSLLPIAGDAVGVTSRGLEYPLEGATLVFGASRGVSNSLTEAEAEVRLLEGVLLVVVIHKDARE